MKKWFPVLTLGVMMAGAPMAAAAPEAADADGSAMLQEHLKSVLNDMAGRVRAAATPADKREILKSFTTRMETGLRDAQGYATLSADDKRSMESLQAVFHAYAAELDGQEGFVRVQDNDLDAYAGYIQQRMEQAPVGGGIYISAGALIIIVLLLILIF